MSRVMVARSTGKHKDVARRDSESCSSVKTGEDVQIDNQPQNLKKYQMYFKRRVIILTLEVYNLNVQKIFKCLQTF